MRNSLSLFFLLPLKSIKLGFLRKPRLGSGMEGELDRELLKLSIWMKSGQEELEERGSLLEEIREINSKRKITVGNQEREKKKRKLTWVKMWALRFKMGSTYENWLSLSFPAPSSSSPNHEDEFLPPKKRKISRANSSRNTEVDRWRDRADEMGLTRRKLYLPNKRVTRSDTNPNQHRLQLTQTDIDKSKKALRDIAKQAKFGGVDINIMDNAGNTYEMVFKYVTSSKTYRFMGRQYTEFLKKSKLKANEIMDIWGLTRDDGGNRGPWLAFVTT